MQGSAHTQCCTMPHVGGCQHAGSGTAACGCPAAGSAPASNHACDLVWGGNVATTLCALCPFCATPPSCTPLPLADVISAGACFVSLNYSVRDDRTIQPRPISFSDRRRQGSPPRTALWLPVAGTAFGVVPRNALAPPETSVRHWRRHGGRDGCLARRDTAGLCIVPAARGCCLLGGWGMTSGGERERTRVDVEKGQSGTAREENARPEWDGQENVLYPERLG